MSKEAVLKIREAEEEAKQIIEDAYAKSRKMISDAEVLSARNCSDFETATRAEYKASVDEVRAGVSEIVSKHKEDDEKRYSEGYELAKAHMNEAVKIILQGVRSECQ